MTHETLGIKELIQKNAMAVLSLLMLGLATYVTYRLAPLVEGLNSATRRISAVEDSDKNTRQYLERFVVVEEKVKTIETKLDKIDIKTDRIEGKIDQLR